MSKRASGGGDEGKGLVPHKTVPSWSRSPFTVYVSTSNPVCQQALQALRDREQAIGAAVAVVTVTRDHPGRAALPPFLRALPTLWERDTHVRTEGVAVMPRIAALKPPPQSKRSRGGMAAAMVGAQRHGASLLNPLPMPRSKTGRGSHFERIDPKDSRRVSLTSRIRQSQLAATKPKMPPDLTPAERLTWIKQQAKAMERRHEAIQKRVMQTIGSSGVLGARPDNS